MASRDGNFCAKNYQNLITGFHVTVENVGDVFFGTQCRTNIHSLIVTTGTVTTDEDTRTCAGDSACSSVSTTHCLIFLFLNRQNR